MFPYGQIWIIVFQASFILTCVCRYGRRLLFKNFKIYKIIIYFILMPNPTLN